MGHFSRIFHMAGLAFSLCIVLYVIFGITRTNSLPAAQMPKLKIWKSSQTDSAFVPELSYQQMKRQLSQRLVQTDDITIVTAYTDLGPFQKGETLVSYEPDIYRRWMATFQNLSNPVIGYFEDEEDVKRFKAIRSHQYHNRSLLVKFARNSTWAFSIGPKISSIFKQPSYPTFHPNTVDSDYSSAMHLKYEVLSHAIELNPFSTKYFAWLDIGYFRDLLHFRNTSKYTLKPPPRFNETFLAVNEVFKRKSSLTPREIIYKNLVWLGGGFFMGTKEVVNKWVIQYKKAVEYFLDKMIMSTDQQVIYGWLNSAPSVVPVQVYRSNGIHNAWFHLGYICKEEGDKT